MEPVLDSSELRAIASEILAVLEAAPAVSAGSVPEERSARYAYLAGERTGQAAPALMWEPSAARSAAYLTMRRAPNEGGDFLGYGAEPGADGGYPLHAPPRRMAADGSGGGARLGFELPGGTGSERRDGLRLLEEASERIRRDSRRYDAPLEKY